MLTAPAFLETNPANLVPDILTQFETALGKTLYPAQLERILVDFIAYREALIRQDIQRTGEQLLVDFATGGYLDALAPKVGVTRLAASKAMTTLCITLPAVSGSDTPFAAGWQAIGPGNVLFELVDSVVITAGNLTVDADARAVTAGSTANGIPPSSSWSPLEGNVAVASLTTTSGGADIESDEALRSRVLAAPSQFSCAGTAAAYRYFALSASPDIVDVAVSRVSPGVVGVYPLTSEGLPSQDILDLVEAALNPDRVRILCFENQVQAPTRVVWNLDATLTFYRGVDVAAGMAAAQTALDAYAADRSAGLGRDLVGSQIIAALMVPGVYKVALTNWTDRILEANEWADDGSLTLHVATERADG